MRKVKLAMYVSLDGVVENPRSSAALANSRSFWSFASSSFQNGPIRAGRVTYEGFAAAWPAMKDEEGFADRMNSMPKFVASTTLDGAEWNATIIDGDVAAEVAGLKEQPGQDLLIYGSGNLVDVLTRHGLVDEDRLMLLPVVVGEGKRLFNDVPLTTLRLVGTKTTATGVAVLTYAPAN